MSGCLDSKVAMANGKCKAHDSRSMTREQPGKAELGQRLQGTDWGPGEGGKGALPPLRSGPRVDACA